MSLDQHVREYGLSDFMKNSQDQITFGDFLKVKPIRIFKECFGIHSISEFNDRKAYGRIVRRKLFHNLIENLPQAAIQLYETFKQGKTVGAFKIFSFGYSIILFQKESADTLPLLLYLLGKRMNDYPRLWPVLKSLIIVLTWSIVYIVMIVPFWLFFEPDRTQWLKEQGVEIIDWSEENQTLIRNFFHVLTAFLSIYLLQLVKSYFRYYIFQR